MKVLANNNLGDFQLTGENGLELKMLGHNRSLTSIMHSVKYKQISL